MKELLSVYSVVFGDLVDQEIWLNEIRLNGTLVQ